MSWQLLNLLPSLGAPYNDTCLLSCFGLRGGGEKKKEKSEAFVSETVEPSRALPK
jgi:hypothetical protein